jgi:diaminopimelate epimerase
VQFSKWHALSNSYLVVEQSDAGPIDPARARKLCDVSTGIGADGVLEIVRRSGDHVEIVIWNPDGSTAEMSGNGVRIAACWLASENGARAITVTVAHRRVEVEILPDGRARADHGRVHVGNVEVLEVGEGEAIEFIGASVGNPHAVVRGDALTRSDLLRLGPRIETHSRFPERTNVQLVRVDGEHDLAVLVWERGAGETASSGSSSVAAAATAVAHGWCSNPVTVHLPGGALTVEVVSGRAWLTGPADVICCGTTDT